MKEEPTGPVSHYFTFGQTHHCNHPSMRGRAADHWVTVTLGPEHMPQTAHRDVFIEHFMQHYCPDDLQFGFEYTEATFDPSFFPAGELVHIRLTTFVW